MARRRGERDGKGGGAGSPRAAGGSGTAGGLELEIATRRVAIDGAWMFDRGVAAPGVAGRRPVVLVHGLGLSGRYMLPTARHLAAHFPVYLPDLPGFGDSARPRRALDVPELAEALGAWLGAARLVPAALLGNSFGCQIIADLAARRPELVARATPPDERSWLWQFVRWRQNQPFNPDSLGPITWSDYRKCGYGRLLQIFRYQLKDRIEEKLPRIAAPTLVVRGARDPICGRGFAEAAARLLPRGRLVEIPEVAHTLVYTAPAQLAQVARAFLEEAKTAPPRSAAGGRMSHGRLGMADGR